MESGLVKSFARPGGNITGVADIDLELVPKRMELFRELVPSLKRVLFAYDAANPFADALVRAHRDGARRLGLALLERPVKTQEEAQAAFASVRTGEVDGILSPRVHSLNIPGFVLEIGAKATATMFHSSFYVERGGLASYGADRHEMGRQAVPRASTPPSPVARASQGGAHMVMRTTPAMTGVLAALAILVLTTSAANAGPSINQATLEEAGQRTPELSTEDLKRVLAAGSAVVLDARPYQEYAMSHIPGARNVAPRAGVSMSMYVSDVAEVERLVGGDRTRALVLYCNGPFCGKSKRLSEELLAAGFTNVRRYQLGMPVWRALGGLAETEVEAVQHVYRNDRTAVFLDARAPEEFGAGSLPGARSIPQGATQPGKDVGEVRRAKDDGRLPMLDHNTRIIVFGRDGAQAKALAEAIIGEAFHNVSYFAGSFDALRSAVK